MDIFRALCGNGCSIAIDPKLGYAHAMTQTNPEPNGAEAYVESRLVALTAVLDEQKALQPFVHRMGHNNDIADAVIVATATSRRHAQGLARALADASRASGQKYARMEGFDAAQWILIDCNDIIIHIFQEDVRDLYRLEEMWTDA